MPQNARYAEGSAASSRGRVLTGTKAVVRVLPKEYAAGPGGRSATVTRPRPSAPPVVEEVALRPSRDHGPAHLRWSRRSLCDRLETTAQRTSAGRGGRSAT